MNENETNGMGDGSLDLELEAVAMQLDSERPVPRAAFRGDLRRHLIAQITHPYIHLIHPRLSHRRIGTLIASCTGSGLTLLGAAALSVAGVGPLAA